MSLAERAEAWMRKKSHQVKLDFRCMRCRITVAHLLGGVHHECRHPIV